MDFLDSVGALRAAQRTTSADRCPRPVGTTARRGLRISRPRPALHRRGPAASVARAPATATAPASLSRVSDCISRSAAGTQQTTSADQCPRPVGTTDATRPPHLTPSASPTPPRPRLLGGAGIRDRGGACVPFSRLSDGIGHRPRPHKPCLQRAAAPGWRTPPAGGQLVRRRPRAIRAAPPSPPQTRPVSNAYGLVLHQVRCRDL